MALEDTEKDTEPDRRQALEGSKEHVKMNLSSEKIETPAELSDEALEMMNRRLEPADPGDVLRWAAGAFHEGRLVISTTFGVGGTVLLHLLAEEGIRIPVIFIDTLHHFPETLEHAERIRRLYDLDLRIERVASSRREFEVAHGPRLWETDEELYHYRTKVEPMKKALRGVDGWITGRRRDQSPTRTELPVIERNSVLKINPLARWTHHQVWDFIRRNDLPYHPLHDEGYPSIGDAPLTTPVELGEHERAGRWRGSVRLECGLHNI